MIPWRALTLAALLLTACDSARLRPAGEATFQPPLEPGDLVLLARFAASGRSGTLARDVTVGTVTTWRTTDNVTLSFDGGVLVATRGLGDDLMAGGAAATLQALTLPGTSGPYPVQRRQLSGDNHDLMTTLTCRMAAAVLVDALSLRVETCQDATGPAWQNRYWVGRDGAVNRSSQWVSPGVGLIELQAVTL
jgi:hypothetical protein